MNDGLPYSSTELVVLITTLGTVLGTLLLSLGNVVVSVLNRGQIKEVKEEAKVIAGHVNSAATASLNKIESLQKEVAALTSTLAEHSQRAALLAQAAAQPTPPSALSPPPL